MIVAVGFSSLFPHRHHAGQGTCPPVSSLPSTKRKEISMTREFRQCWAYYEGNRCSLRAGHANDHVRKVTWADSDSQGAPLIEVLAVDTPIPFVPVAAPKSDKCVACHHAHTGECRCSCKEFIG